MTLSTWWYHAACFYAETFLLLRKSTKMLKELLFLAQISTKSFDPAIVLMWEEGEGKMN